METKKKRWENGEFLNQSIFKAYFNLSDERLLERVLSCSYLMLKNISLLLFLGCAQKQ